MNRIDVVKNKEEGITRAIEVLKSGGLIIYPTETCYGLGGDATNPEALKKIMEYKKLRGSKPISIAVADKKMAEEYVEINEMAENLYNNYLPGPITVISMSKGELVPPVVSIQGGVGIRYPDYDFSLEMIKIAHSKMPDANLLQWDFTLGVPPALRNQTFDFIIGTYALHHLSDDAKVDFIAELLGLLAPQGAILIGDVCFQTRSALLSCKAACGNTWDTDEIYFVFSELQERLSPFCRMAFHEFSFCSGVIEIRKS